MGSTTVAPRRRLAILGGILAVLCVGAPRLHRENLFSEGGVLNEMRGLPPFPEGSWIGTEPLTLDAMRGRVWVLKVWIAIYESAGVGSAKSTTEPCGPQRWKSSSTSCSPSR